MHQEPTKKVHVETWGCQMNVADSERMLALLAEQNYQITTVPDDADLILLNTCHIREKAKHKVLSRLGVLRTIKEKNPDLKIAVAGCVAQAEGKKLLKAAPQIDIIFGPGKIEQLPEILAMHKQSGKPEVSVGFDKNAKDLYQKKVPPLAHTVGGKNDVSRFVNIQHGCNNFCTFCVVPFTRGKEISRTPPEILEECKQLIANGARELTVLGQNVNSYGLDLVSTQRIPHSNTGPFVDLLAQVANLDGIERLRFTTSNPHDFTESLAELLSNQPKLGKYIHLPVQCGNNEILKAMRRKVTVEEFYNKISWLNSRIPDIAISTDLIVGFPGETEEQFSGTLDLISKVRFSFVYAFKYSPRKGTAAARFKNQVPEEVKDRRLGELNKIQNQITIDLNKKEIGKSREVLFLYESKKSPGVYYGRTEHFRLTRVESNNDLTGKLLPVKILDANKTALSGKLL